MSNVKPGDLAKATERSSLREVVGAEFLVLREPDPIVDNNAPKMASLHGQIWVIQCLQTIYLHDGTIFHAGEEILGADCSLRRIDPPADADETDQLIEEVVHG